MCGLIRHTFYESLVKYMLPNANVNFYGFHKEVLNILYYEFIEKSRFFSGNMFFHVLLHREFENVKKQPLGPHSSQLPNFIFF